MENETDPQLFRLFRVNRVLNAKTLEELLKTSLNYMEQCKVTIERLVGSIDFIHILVKGLRCDLLKNTTGQVQMQAALLLQRLMERAEKPQAEVIVSSGVLPLLVKLLASPQKAVCVQTLMALNSTAEQGFREELHSADVLPALLNLIQRQPSCPVILQLTTLHASFLCLTPFEVNRRQEGPMRSPFMSIRSRDQTSFKSSLPSGTFMKEMVPLLAKLMETNCVMNIEKIHGLNTAIASKIGIRDDTLSALMQSGIVRRIVALLAYPQEFVSAGAITAIGCIAHISEVSNSKVMLEFLQGLAAKKNDGLKHMYKFLKSDRPEISDIAMKMLIKVIHLIEGSSSENAEVVCCAILQSGYIHVLLNCLKLEKSCLSKEHLFNVIWSLRILLRHMTPYQKQFLIGASINPLLVNLIVTISSSAEDQDNFICSAAVDCLLSVVTTVDKLVNCSDFLRVVLKGLQTASSSPSIQMHASSLLQHLMGRATLPEAKKVVESGVLPLLVDCVGSKHKTVMVQAVMALNNTAKQGFRQELHAAGVIQALLQLTSKQESSPVMTQCVALIVYNLCKFPGSDSNSKKLNQHEKQVDQTFSQGFPFDMDNPADEDFLREVIPLVGKLIDSNVVHNVKEIHALLTLILCQIGRVTDTLHWLGSATILKKIVMRLNHPQEFVRLGAVKIIGSIVHIEEDSVGELALKFLQVLACEGNDGLNCFHKCLMSDESEVKMIAFRLVHVVASQILQDEGWSAVNAVINSGFINVFLECLKLGRLNYVARKPEEDFRMTVVSAVKQIALKASPYQTESLVNLGIIALFVEVIDSCRKRDPLICVEAVNCLVNVMDKKSDYRNQLLAHGALPVMLKLLTQKSKAKNFQQLFESILAAIEMMVTVKPEAPLENFKAVPESLKRVFKSNQNIKLNDECVASLMRTVSVFIIEYGPSGNDLIVKSGFLPVLTKFLNLNLSQDDIHMSEFMTLIKDVGMN